MTTERKYGSKVRIVFILLLVTAGFVALCGFAAGQVCGPCPVFNPLPVTMAGPGGAVASAGGVTACAGVTGAVASAGGVAAGASALYPAAFAGPVLPYYDPGLLI